MSESPLLLVIDVGNTNTVFGVFREGEDTPDFHKRTVTRRDRTSDELGLFLKGFLTQENVKADRVKMAIYSSVVPSLNPIVERMLEDWFNVNPLRVHYQMKLNFGISYPRPFEIGADRLVNAAYCAKTYPGKKAILVDLGTATTFCVISEKPEYVGGVIAPGLKISMDALTRNTAQLPPIVFGSPSRVLGESTVESIQAGFFFGWIGLLKEIVRAIKEEHPGDYVVVGTGGLVTTIHASHNQVFDEIDPMMTLKGLKILADLNS
ncbi:type III pantothenate kinase [Leptospira harrisiae]|uniref:Type III pantothenate kinase n=1 Tax=Leptospira harrisiae TaxID=2023189 RepID=A0A2N0AJJ9_9LEPT|nr:type III pantothenate kinase [Leptospira harrisiae]PJZ84440.1 pantothenate kinase [Leptospira harrisiae]PKA07184.1 pantothenate kinase [Leptospira harrisiae]